eukprot:UN30700
MNMPELIFVVRGRLVTTYLQRIDLQKATKELNLMIKIYKGIKLSSDMKTNMASIIHALIAHLAVCLRDWIHAKNHFKRLYRVVPKTNTVLRVYSRLQLALLRLQNLKSNISESDLTKSRKEMERYYTEIKNKIVRYWSIMVVLD